MILPLLFLAVMSSGADTFAGVKSVSIDVGKEAVLVESSLTSAEVQALIESTGRRAVLKGIGGSEQGEEQGGLLTRTLKARTKSL